MKKYSTKLKEILFAADIELLLLSILVVAIAPMALIAGYIYLSGE